MVMGVTGMEVVGVTMDTVGVDETRMVSGRSLVYS